MEHPQGGVCADPKGRCPLKDSPAPHISSNWFGKRPSKICRACFGYLNQRKECLPRSACQQVASTSAAAAVGLENEQDSAAPLEKIFKVIGSR